MSKVSQVHSVVQMNNGLILTASPLAGLNSPAGIGTISHVTVVPGMVSVNFFPPGSAGLGASAASAKMAIEQVKMMMQRRFIQTFSKGCLNDIHAAGLIVVIAALMCGGCAGHTSAGADRAGDRPALQQGLGEPARPRAGQSPALLRV